MLVTTRNATESKLTSITESGGRRTKKSGTSIKGDTEKITRSIFNNTKRTSPKIIRSAAKSIVVDIIKITNQRSMRETSGGVRITEIV